MAGQESEWKNCDKCHMSFKDGDLGEFFCFNCGWEGDESDVSDKVNRVCPNCGEKL